MCLACDEMAMFYAYLDEVEEAKKRAQPWQCEVTVIPQDAATAKLASATPAKAKPDFSCDETE